MTNIIQIYLERYKVLSPEISDEELVFVKSNLTVTELGKNSFYLEAGKVQKDMGFIYCGLIRAFYIDLNGDEITMGFIKENEYVTHYSSFSEQQPSRYSFQCLEECKIINLPYGKMTEGIATYKNLERYARIFKERVTDLQQNRIESLLYENAEQRYLNFIKKHPELFNRISLTHLASFLGIGRQSLSRIRKKLATK
jgi:CRP/FNR family transcriptional regulator